MFYIFRYNDIHHISDILFFPFYAIPLSCFYMWSLISGFGLISALSYNILKIFWNSDISINDLIVYIFWWFNISVCYSCLNRTYSVSTSFRKHKPEKLMYQNIETANTDKDKIIQTLLTNATQNGYRLAICIITDTLNKKD